MMCDWIHPGLLLILAGLISPLIRGVWCSIWILAAPIVSLWLIWSVPSVSECTITFLDYNLTPLSVDSLSRLFATIFSVMCFIGTLYCFKQAKKLELSAALVYAGAAIGVTFAGDLITLFIFWEIMALGSTLVLWSAGTRSSWQSGMRYVLIHLLGGVVLMAGIVAYSQETGSIDFIAMSPGSLGTWLILAGFLLNAGAPPLSAWLADAYPEASFSGMVFLSAFTTKAAVYVLLRGFPGTDLLIYIGLFMIFYGIIYALLENDIRRILAYSIINQVGFMVCGIGIGTELALNGAAAHAFTHIIYKALLLMSAGSVLYMTGKRKCTDLGGLIHSMPFTAVCGIIGALAISAFPLTSGFISKSMITQTAAENQLLLVWILLQAASAGVFLHAGIKFPWFVFFQKDSGLRPAEAPLNMRLAMLIFAFLCILLGIMPELLYGILPYKVDYVPYTAPHVITQLQLLLFSGLAFFVMLPWMQRTLTISLDFDWFYRKLFPRSWNTARRSYGSLETCTKELGNRVLCYVGLGFSRIYGEEGFITKTGQTNYAVFMVMVFLLVYLLFYLFNLT